MNKHLIKSALLLLFFNSATQADYLEDNTFNVGRSMQSLPFPQTSYQTQLGDSFLDLARSTGKEQKIFDVGSGTAKAWYELFFDKKDRSIPGLNLFLLNRENLPLVYHAALEELVGRNRFHVTEGDFADRAIVEPYAGQYDLGTDNNGAFSYSPHPDKVLRNAFLLLKPGGTLFLTYDWYMHTWEKPLGSINPIGKRFGPNFLVITKEYANKIGIKGLEKMIEERDSKLFVDNNMTEAWFDSIGGVTCSVDDGNYESLYKYYDTDALSGPQGILHGAITSDLTQRFAVTPLEEINAWKIVKCQKTSGVARVNELTKVIIKKGRPDMRVYSY